MIKNALTFLNTRYNHALEVQQVRMASSYDGIPLLALLGLFCGLVSGGIIILFRLSIDGGSEQLFGTANIENFESLSRTARFLLCAGGGLVVGLLLHFSKAKNRTVGVVHVIERLDYHQGRLPIKNAIMQFLAGTISLLSGHSVGREGPSVHLGASAGSLLGQLLRVPNNSLRILVGCGVAAAIAAAFNTPLAGVIFAMEVVIMEYSVIGFTPVIIAAVSATTLTHLIFGDQSAFNIPQFELNAIHEIPIVVVMGAIIGCISAAFIQLTLVSSSICAQNAIWVRTLLAGIITGFIALLLPQVMGTGYDTVNHILLAQIGLSGVILLTIAKTLTTATAIGLGIPAGLIGPVLFIGAAAGSTIGLIASTLFSDVANAGFYAMLGMASMMAATLQAPLAALIYLLELTDKQSIILPGMAAVVTASLVTRVVFKKESIYRHLLLSRGLDYRNSPMSKTLRRIGVASVMERNIIQHPRRISYQQANELLKQEPRWILITNIQNTESDDKQEQTKASLLPATDLARHLNELNDTDVPDNKADSQSANNTDSESLIDLLRIPAKRLDTDQIEIIATLQEAHEKMQASNCEVLFITGAHGKNKHRIYGVVTRKHIDSSYRV